MSVLRISVDLTTDLARSFSLCALTISSGSPSSYSGKKQKCQNTSKEVIQVAFFGLTRNIGVWKFNEGDCSHTDKFPTCTSSGLALQVLVGLNLH